MNINREQKPVELDIVATGHKIKLLMEEREIAIKDLSKVMNVSFQAVYRWQKGEALPTISNMFILFFELVNFLGINLSLLYLILFY